MTDRRKHTAFALALAGTTGIALGHVSHKRRGDSDE